MPFWPDQVVWLWEIHFSSLDLRYLICILKMVCLISFMECCSTFSQFTFGFEIRCMIFLLPPLPPPVLVGNYSFCVATDSNGDFRVNIIHPRSGASWNTSSWQSDQSKDSYMVQARKIRVLPRVLWRMPSALGLQCQRNMSLALLVAIMSTVWKLSVSETKRKVASFEVLHLSGPVPDLLLHFSVYIFFVHD